MSVESISLVLNHSKAEGTDKLVLIGIANHDGDGGAWPSIATLARYANITERSVQYALRRLEQLGELETITNAGGTNLTRNDRRPNRYNILLENGVKPTAPRAVLRGEVERENGVKPTAPEPSFEPSITTPTPSRRKRSGLDAKERNDDFDAWWALYPRKAGRFDAIKAWRQVLCELPPLDDLLDATHRLIAWQNREHSTDNTFTPYPATWLRAGRWLDEGDVTSAPTLEIVRACIMCAAPNPRQECNGPNYIGEDFDMAECPWRR